MPALFAGMLSLNDLVNAIAVKLHGRLSVDTNLYGRKNSCIYTCRIVRIVEEDEKTQYEVEWMDKYDDISECTLVNEEDLIRKKLPYSRGVLKLLIRESTYRSIPWVLHDKLAKEHGIPTHPPPELESEISLKDGLVVVNKKRKRSECSQTDMVIISVSSFLFLLFWGGGVPFPVTISNMMFLFL